MKGDLIEAEAACPYCGEVIDVLIDGSIEQQDYIEDCQVCCRPIVFKVQLGDGEVYLQTFSEND